MATFLAVPSMDASTFSSLKPRSSLTTCSWLNEQRLCEQRGKAGTHMCQGSMATAHSHTPNSLRRLPAAKCTQFTNSSSNPPSLCSAHRAAGQHSNVLQVCLAVVAKAGGLDGAHLDARPQLVHNQGGQRLCIKGGEGVQ